MRVLRKMMALRNTADAIVIGGGIHGCSAALHLVLRKLSVIVLEKDYVGCHASGVNAGGVRRLGRDFTELPLAQAAWEMWQDMPALVDDDCGYRQSRYLKVARNDVQLEAARARVAELNRRGFTHEEVIDRHILRRLLPACGNHCLGALHVEGDGAALPFRTTQAFKRRAEVLGAYFSEQTPVNRVTRRKSLWHVTTPCGNFEAPVLINAAGAWGGNFAKKVGDDIPLEAHAPMLVSTQSLPAFAEPIVGALGAALSFKQFPNGTVLIGGGVCGEAFPSENRTRLDIAGLERVLNTARDIFPIISKAQVNRAWAGIEGYTPDQLPVIGRGGAPGILHAFGFSAHGFQLAPAVGGVVAALVMDETPNLSLHSFSPDRFSSSK